MRAKDFAQNQQRFAVLTNRQQQVATLVCDGLSNKLIARKLGLTEGTVKIHLVAIYKKLDVSSRTELMIALAGRRQSSNF
jgi:two-component system nitrate/nitrite response regulator NarL